MKKFLAVISLLILFGCGSDGEEITGTPITVNFREASQRISESSTADVIIIEFSEPADFDGIIEISLEEGSALYDTDFTTQPTSQSSEILVAFNSGATQATIIVAPTPDSDNNVDSFELIISGGNSDLIQIGTQNSVTIEITEPNNGGDDGNNTGSGTCNNVTYDTGTVQCTPAQETDELEVVTWNIENFPMRSGTIATVIDIIQDMNADIYAVQEIDEISAFNSVVSSLNGYEGVVTDVNGTIELGYIYKTSEITSFGTPKKLFGGLTSPFPREPVEVDITHSNGLSVKLINIHLKCCSGSEDRRTDASIRMKAYIDENFPNDEVIILGDWNEDFDSGSSFTNFLNDSENFIFADLPIYNGSGADYSFPCTGASFCPSHIDHILVTNELCDNLVATYTARLDDCVSSYLSQVSDHRPVMIKLKADD